MMACGMSVGDCLDYINSSEKVHPVQEVHVWIWAFDYVRTDKQG